MYYILKKVFIKGVRMGTMAGIRLREKRVELGLTQLQLAHKADLSEAAVRSYELGVRNPKVEHRKRLAKALGVHPEYLIDYYDYDFDQIIHFLMDMEERGYIRPLMIDGMTYLVPTMPDLEEGIQEWGEEAYRYHTQQITLDEYIAWKSKYEQAGALHRIKKQVANKHFDWAVATLNRLHMEQELEKLPTDEEREKLRPVLEEIISDKEANRAEK